MTNIRTVVIGMGHKVPGNSCGTRANCCKDINCCDHFVIFDYGHLHPRAATIEPKEKEVEDNATA